MKFFIVLTAILAILTSCSTEPKDIIVTPSERDASDPLSSFQAIDEAMASYHFDFGEDIQTVNQLINFEYLRLDEEVTNDWMFFLFRRDPITHIYATSSIDNPLGPGFVMDYELQTKTMADRGITVHDSLDVLAALKSFEHGIKLYEKKIGRSPLFIKDFFKGKFVKFKPTIEKEWSFHIVEDIDDVTSYVALRREIFPNKESHYAAISDVTTDWAKAFEIHKLEPTNGMDAMRTLLDITSALEVSRTYKDSDASSVEKLIELGYLKIDQFVSNDWMFSVIGTNPVTQIESISTDSFNGGGGNVILLDLASGKFSGYGLPSMGDI